VKYNRAKREEVYRVLGQGTFVLFREWILLANRGQVRYGFAYKYLLKII
jgi:hypothetical protein